MLLNNVLNLDSFENSLRNATFLTLFFTTIFYWIYTAFYTPTTKQNKNMENLKTNAFLSVFSKLFLVQTINSKYLQSNILFLRSSMAISNLLLIILLLVRWDKSGHFPLSNLYESLMFLAWCCTFLYLIYSTSFTILVEKILGSIIAPCALLMNAFATFSLPKEMQDSAPLVPALQSNWLMMHVTVMIISYATLIIGSLLSILFLILNMIYADSHIINRLTTNNVSLTKFTWLFFGSNNTESAEKNAGLMVLLLKLDSLSYRIIGLGFPFLTIGILSGAVWANEAWGSYWSWDPKETWALLTWLVFAIYLHTRLTKGWEGKKPAVIASIGFLVVWFCYLGVNLIGEGLHSYGFFN
uniref:Cytochrome c biogenesis protein CcsA n=1 Tax=Gonium pectorale TaxID=33097 RepID=M1VQI4_GONPE|nr:cytochrome c biogenesis protein [Gonium pectorale]BAM85988.1 cytochrome c biogenesis protein [Gonium pectorale]